MHGEIRHIPSWCIAELSTVKASDADVKLFRIGYTMLPGSLSWLMWYEGDKSVHYMDTLTWLRLRCYAFQGACSFCIWNFDQYKSMCQVHCLCSLRLGSMAALLLGLQVQILLGTWMSAPCECCVLSGWSPVQRSPTMCGASVISKPQQGA